LLVLRGAYPESLGKELPMLKHAAFPVLVVVVAPLIAGCDKYIDLSTCGTDHPAPSCPKEETCPGQCVPIPPVLWTDPLLLWSGEELMAPDCPADRAGKIVYEGHADPVDPPECPTCTCEPPAGECGLPSSLIASSEFCGQAGMEFDFSGLDPNPLACDQENAIVGMGDLKSVTISALTVTESGCTSTAIPPPPKTGAMSWKTYARACRGVAYPPCLDPGLLCVPTAEPPPEGFSQCIYRDGDNECPPEYPDKRVFFQDLDDTRTCSSCTCGEPVGSTCTVVISVYEGIGCTMPADTLGADSIAPTCQSIPPVPTLFGKEVDDLTYAPGECPPSGGELVGSADPEGQSTFCCQP